MVTLTAMTKDVDSTWIIVQYFTNHRAKWIRIGFDVVFIKLRCVIVVSINLKRKALKLLIIINKVPKYEPTYGNAGDPATDEQHRT